MPEPDERFVIQVEDTDAFRSARSARSRIDTPIRRKTESRLAVRLERTDRKGLRASCGRAVWQICPTVYAGKQVAIVDRLFQGGALSCNVTQ
jgi:hypothetical protein